eukprot:MONOS_538.1-p1 / transcript=MONOS_538.1 / gene=MONOS_538 / organism=Monocercomonoides_exilis_PA203 / gene_product=unspecified product / transcript_product=unspecified product / location=Mono_scaffold00008:220647-227882(+) / protein_length=2412 / sequence_SO=supercontig / SO=protein_coding / is_pseudo=false
MCLDEEWKGSVVSGCVCACNSSFELRGMTLTRHERGSVVYGMRGSVIVASGCVIGVERETSPFDFCGSCGLFTNISLRSSSTLTEQIFPPLFSSKAMEGEISEKCHVSVCSSHFSSFCVSSAPFISSHFVSLSQLEFFNISTNPPKISHLDEGPSQRVFLMSGCSFSSVWDVYDGGIVPSLNSPSSSLAASNTSFVRCYRSQNVAISGSEGNPSKPARQQIADNGANSFTWCVWNGSKTTGTSSSYSDGISSGGAINMYGLSSGTLSVKFCSFNDCYANYAGGGIFCYSINSVKIENNSFNACTAKNDYGGGMYARSISSCVRISGCEFQKCKASGAGGGLYLYNFNVSGSSCIGTESGKGESACVFECLFTLCSLTGSSGGGMYCYGIPVQFKMRSIQFISCSAVSYGGGLFFYPDQSTLPSFNHYCYFFFFHDCRCTATSTPYGHDVYFEDYYNLFSSYNPFYDSCTTNSNEERVCYHGDNIKHTQKKDWLKNKTIYVGVYGNDSSNLCGMSESAPCKTVGHAVGSSMGKLITLIVVQSGRHGSEGTTISVGEKKIIITGKGKTMSVIGMNSLSSTSTTLFSISTGQLEVRHVGIDHNATRSPSPSVFVASVGSGSLSLEDVVINSSTSGGSGISASVFEVALRQLKMVNVEIKNMKTSQPLFTEPSSTGSAFEESLLGNLTIRNVNRTERDGVVVAKSVKEGEIFVVWNTTMEGCECKSGNGGGMKIELEGISSKARIGDSTSHSGGTTGFNQCKSSGCGGGILLRCEEGGSDFVMNGLTFGRGKKANTATYGGNNVFIEGTNLPQLVNSASFDFSFEIEGDGFDIKDLMGAENGNELKLIPVVVFFREKPSVGYVNGGNGGMDYHKCGYFDFACSTLIYAGTSVFDTSTATLKLVDGSSISDEMTLNTQEMNIDGDISKAKIGISEGGENVFLIKSEQAISFSSLEFSVSTFAESRKEYVFLCSSSTLRFEGCSFGAESEEIGVGLICGKGGKVELVKCELENIRMTETGMVTFDGAGVGGLIDEVIVRNVTRENVGRSLFELRNGGDVEIKNTTMNGSSFENGNEIEIGEGIDCEINNCSFKSIQRDNGNGGVLNGRVGSGKCVDINKCVFEGCRCESMSAIGGGIVMIVGDGGNLLFDDNKINGCTVAERSGKGGGLHLTFETTNIEYSVKNDDFANNVAEKGEDVYLVCGSPWTMLLPALWEGTATRVTAENKMWVLESSEQRKEDSLINYLFPRLGTDLFVSNTGNGLSSCGAKENPCSSVDIGFDRLNDEIERIMLVGAASVSKTINRGGKGLTIKGNEVTKKLVVEEGGKFELIEGDGQTHLTLSLLQISLPCSSSASASGDESIVEVRIGECFILDCLLSGGEGNTNTNGNECGKWIVIGNGGVIRIERTEMNGITFEGCGIARFGGGNMIFENCSLDGVETSGGGVIVGNCGSEITLRNMTALGCVVGAGSLITSNGGSSLRVDGESRFEDIETESVSGGCLKSEMKLNDLLEMGSSSILRCSANGNGGRGGGIYLDLSDNCVNNFALTTLTFKENVAAEGRDLFISCKKLNETVKKERFGFEYKYENGEGEWMAVDMKGIDRDHFEESVDLGLFLVEMKGMEVCVSREGYDTLGCGSDAFSCYSIDYGLTHLTSDFISLMFIVDESVIGEEINLEEMSLSSKSREMCKVEVESGIERTRGALLKTTGTVSLLRVNFVFDSNFIFQHESLISPEEGILELLNCSFVSKQSNEEGNIKLAIIPFHIINMEKGELQLDGCTMSNLILHESALYLSPSLPSVIDSFTICNSTIKTSLININECGQLNMEKFHSENITVEGNEESLISCLTMKKTMQLTNCTMDGISSKTTKGKLMKLEDCLDVKMDSCIFDGSAKERNEQYLNAEEEMCRWDGSLVDIVKSSVLMKDSTISNSAEGGITMSGGEMIVNDGRFENNNPFIEGYPSLRRNIICSDSGTLKVIRLKGGDGVLPNTSLWMLNEGCIFEGIISERDSSFFIPVLESVEEKEETDRMKLTFIGLLFIPCNLSFSVVKRKGEEKEIEKHDFDSNGFLSEKEAEGSVAKDLISSCGNEIEVSVSILFGNAELPSSTNSFVLKNKTETEPKGDVIMSKGEEKIEWSLIAFIGCIIVLLIFVALFVVVVVQLRKKQNGGGRRVEDGDIEESKNVGRGEWRKEDVAERVEEEEEEMRTLFVGEAVNEMGVPTEKGEESDVCKNKEMVGSGFDREEIIAVVPVNYVEIQTIASLQSCGEKGSMESTACAGGKKDQNMQKRDGKAKKGKRRKGKKQKQVEEADEIEDETRGSEIGLEKLSRVAADDGRNGKPTEYYIEICSGPNSHFSMIEEDSEEQGMKGIMEEEKEVVEEREREEIGEEKQKKRKKKKKRNQKRKEKFEFVEDVAGMRLLDAG